MLLCRNCVRRRLMNSSLHRFPCLLSFTSCFTLVFFSLLSLNAARFIASLFRTTSSFLQSRYKHGHQFSCSFVVCFDTFKQQCPESFCILLHAFEYDKSIIGTCSTLRFVCCFLLLSAIFPFFPPIFPLMPYTWLLLAILKPLNCRRIFCSISSSVASSFWYRNSGEALLASS